MKEKKNNLKTIVLILIAFFAALAVITIISKMNRLPASQSTTSTQQLSLQPAISQSKISREFIFPISNTSGEKAGEFKYIIDSAELRNQIIIKGKRMTAVKGRIFLIINLKLQNEMNQNVQINSRNYIRLSLNKNQKEWLAPDIHNDPVEIQAISTKYTRIGFAINESDKDLKLRIGEINGDKKMIDLKF